MTTMFTVCPKCTLTLAVTADDLRTGQGYVRCGRCLNVFNALLALSEEPSDADPQPSYSQADPASHSQITNALSSASLSDSQRTRLATEVSSDGSIENESSLAEGTGSFQTIVLEGDSAMQTEEFAPQEAVDSEIAALTERLEAQSSQLDAAPESDDEDAPDQEPQEDEEFVLAEVTALEPAAAPHQLRWAIGAAALGLLLIVQGVNHWRDSLAATRLFSRPITHLYAGLGLPIDPHWDLTAYDVRQQGATTDSGDNHLIRVRVSLANNAPRSQPVPLLRLTLLDRYGKRIAARDLKPAEYWPHGKPISSFLAHDERIDSEIAVRDPGADSASFDLDVCLANVRGAVRCQSELPPTSTPAS